MTLYMAVTADRYELPVAVETSVRILAQKMQTTENRIFCQMCMREKRRGRKRLYESHCGAIKYVRVRVQED